MITHSSSICLLHGVGGGCGRKGGGGGGGEGVACLICGLSYW